MVQVSIPAGCAPPQLWWSQCCGLGFWLQARRGWAFHPCLGAKGGVATFVMARLGSVGEEVPGPVTGITKHSPGSNFASAPGPSHVNQRLCK